MSKPLKRLVVTSGSHTTTVDVLSPASVTIDGRAWTVEVVGAGEYLIGDGSRRRRVFVAGTAETRQVFLDGVVFHVEVVPQGASRAKVQASHEGSLSAPMPATVTEILVSAGQTVRAGDTLLKLEAMKMELPIRAPGDGVVREVTCRVGELVQAGVPLIEFEVTRDE